MTTTEILSKVPIFSHMTAQQIEPLTQKLRRRSYQRGEVVFHQDDPGDRMHIIMQGRVRISIDSDDGREKDVGLLQQGECFGEMSLLDGSNRSATATAIEALDTLVLLRQDFFELMSEHPKVALDITAVLTQRLRNVNHMLGDLAFLDVPTRVAKQLLELTRTYADSDSEDGSIVVHLGQDELARMVGASRETVSRALNNYRSMGVLSTSHRRISINDMKALERMASS